MFVVNNNHFMFSESVLANSNFNIITLPHPSHGSPTKYCLDEVNHKIYEIITFSEPYRSWFIGDTVKSDGNLLITTPINPLFLGVFILLIVIVKCSFNINIFGDII